MNANENSPLGAKDLILAAEEGREDVVDSLLKKGADVTGCDDENKTILHHAAELGWLNIVKKVTQTGKLNINSKSTSGHTPAMLSAVGRHKEATHFLYEIGADVTVLDNKGWSLLHHVSARGWLDIVQNIVKSDKLDINLKAIDGVTPLLLGARSYNKKLVEFFLKMGSDITASDGYGWTILHYASTQGWLDIIQELLPTKKLDIDLKTKNNESPIMIAANCKHWELVNFFLKVGADINVYDNFNQTVLHHASKHGQLDVVQSIVKTNKLDINLSTGDCDSPLLLAACNEAKAVVEFLLKNGSDITACNDNKVTLLHCASQWGWLDVVKLIVEKRSLNVNLKIKCGLSPLLIAARKQRKEVVDFLLTIGSDITARDNCNATVLHYASLFGWLDTLKQIIKTGILNINLETVYCQTPLYLAALHGNKEVVDFLINLGADLNVCDTKYNSNLLHVACFHGWIDVLKYIVETTNINIELKMRNGNSPLLIAALCKYKDIVDFLLNKCPNLNISNVRGCTLLHLACFNGWLDILQCISSNYHIIVNLPTHSQRNPLLIAATEDNMDIVNFLLQLGPDHWCPISEVQFTKMTNHRELAKLLAKNVNFCTYATIHIFNDKLLPLLFTKFNLAQELPSINMLKVHHESNVCNLIRHFISKVIESKKKCNPEEVRPPVLKLICVRFILHQCSLKTPAPIDFESSCTKFIQI